MKTKHIILLATAQMIGLNFFGQANNSLSNLNTPTTINTALLPASDGFIDLGSPSNSYKDFFMEGKLTIPGMVLRSSGSSNTSIYFNSNGSPAATGMVNTCFGPNAGISLTTGMANTFLGEKAGMSCVIGVNNTCLGLNAGRLVEGNWNTLVGSTAGSMLYGGDGNVIVGSEAGQQTVTGDHNVFIGLSCAMVNSEGSDNVCIGNKAGFGLYGGMGNTIIGNNADMTSGGYLNNASCFGNFSRIAISNGMSFGSDQVRRWGFGISLSGVAVTKALVVGSTTINGNGAFLTNGGAWTNASSRAFKEDITKLNSFEILARVNQLDLTRWKYTGTDEYHIGPMAEQFYELFEVGVDNQSVSSVDPAGVALISVQALTQQLEEKEQRITELENTVSEMKYCMEKMCDLEEKLLHVTEQPSSSHMQCYPNPVSERATFVYSVPQGDKYVSMRFIDMNGAIAMEVSLNAASTTAEIAVDVLAKGYYQCVLMADGIALDATTLIVSR